MIKKIKPLLLCGMMSLSFMGCNIKNNNIEPIDGSENVPTTEESQES